MRMKNIIRITLVSFVRLAPYFQAWMQRALSGNSVLLKDLLHEQNGLKHTKSLWLCLILYFLGQRPAAWFCKFILFSAAVQSYQNDSTLILKDVN